MFFEKLMKWMAEEFSTRSRLLITPATLAAHPAMFFEAPDPLLTLGEWLGCEDRRPTPAKAVVFLEVRGDDTLATIVDTGQQRIAARVRLCRDEIATFSAAFLRTSQDGDARSILFAPYALNEQAAQPAAPSPKSDKTSKVPTSAPSAPSTNGVTPIGEKPTEPPKFQSLPQPA